VEALDKMELEALDKVEVVALNKWRWGSYCTRIYSLQSLSACSNKMLCATTSKILVGSHSAFGSGVVSLPTFPTMYC